MLLRHTCLPIPSFPHILSEYRGSNSANWLGKPEHYRYAIFAIKEHWLTGSVSEASVDPLLITHSFLLRRGWVTIPTRITRAIWLAISPVSSTVALSIIFQQCVSVILCLTYSTRSPKPVSVYVEIINIFLIRKLFYYMLFPIIPSLTVFVFWFKRIQLTITIWTYHSQIFSSIVRSVTINMI